MGRLRQCRSAVWFGLLALLVQFFVPPLHDAHDIAAAFARAARESQQPANIARLALALLDEHRHGVSVPAVDADHAAGHHHAADIPTGSHHPAGHESDGLPCPIVQAAHAAANFVVPVLPVLFSPTAPVVTQQAAEIGALHRAAGFSRPRTRAPPGIV